MGDWDAKLTWDGSTPEPLWKKALALIAVSAFVAVLLWVSGCAVAPPAPLRGPIPLVPSQSACQYLADYALVARALAQDGSISELQADTALERIYVIHDPIVDEVQRLLRDHARNETVRNAQRYSGEFLQTCIERRGVIDLFFGI